MIKRLFAIGLLLILLVPLAGGYLFFKLRQYQIREMMEQRIKNGISKDELTLVKIPDKWQEGSHSSFTWVEDNEFRYKGRMYDIVEQEKHGDTTRYYCILDHEESALYSKLEEMTTSAMKHDPASQKQQQNLRHLLTNLYLSELPNFGHTISSWRIIATPYHFSLKTFVQPPLSPPPLA